jgi:hypothetical protein
MEYLPRQDIEKALSSMARERQTRTPRIMLECNGVVAPLVHWAHEIAFKRSCKENSVRAVLLRLGQEGRAYGLSWRRVDSGGAVS